MDKINYYYLIFLTIFLGSTHNSYANTTKEKVNDNIIQIGQTVADNGFLYRKLIGITKNNSYEVQNFYKDTNTQQSSPFIIENKANLSVFQELQIYNLRKLIFQGPLTLWSKEGKQSMNMIVNNGNAEGLFTKYYTDTENKEVEGYYYKGLPDGLWIFSDPNGAVEKKVYYKRGITQWQYDTPQLPKPIN